MFMLAVLGVNCIYLLSELIFNAQLMNVASANSTPQEIENLEVFGRALSSIGISLFLIKIINITSFAKNIKIFLSVAVILTAHPIFFIGQKELIDNLANNASMADKSNYYNTYLVKKSILGEEIHGKKMNVFDSSDSIPYKSFLATIGLLQNDSRMIQLFKKEDKLIETASLADSKFFSDTLFENYIKFTQDNDDLYDEYRVVQRLYESKLDILTSEVLENYNRYTSEKSRNGLFNQYKDTVKGVNHGREFFQTQMAQSVMNEAWAVSKCVNQNCLNSKIKNFKEAQINIAKRYLRDETQGFPVYSFEGNCSFKSNPKNYGQTFMNYISNGSKSTRRSNNNLKKAGVSQDRMECFFNLDAMSQRYVTFFNNAVQNKIYIENYNHKNAESFSNSRDFRNAMVSMAKQEGVSLNLPQNWHYSEKDVFMNNATASFKQRLTSSFQEKMIEDIGIAFPLDLTKEEFMNSDSVKEYVNQEYERKFNLVILEDNKTDFYQNNKEQLIATKEKQIKSFDLEENGGDVIKAMIIPPISLFLSLVFFLLNAILFVRSLVYNSNKKAANIMAITLFAFIIIVPFLIPFSDGGHSFIVNDLKQDNILLSLVYNWMVKMEFIIYPIGNLINETVVPLISKYSPF